MKLEHRFVIDAASVQRTIAGELRAAFASFKIPDNKELLGTVATRISHNAIGNIQTQLDKLSQEDINNAENIRLRQLIKEKDLKIQTQAKVIQDLLPWKRELQDVENAVPAEVMARGLVKNDPETKDAFSKAVFNNDRAVVLPVLKALRLLFPIMGPQSTVGSLAAECLTSVSAYGEDAIHGGLIAIVALNRPSLLPAVVRHTSADFKIVSIMLEALTAVCSVIRSPRIYP